MLLDALRSRVLFVGGKGGVGKTTISSAVAVARAAEGARVLVVSTDPAHNLGHLWGRAVADEPMRLAAVGSGVVDGVEIDPDATIARHLAAVEQTMLRMLPERQHAQVREHLERARHAPGSHESAVLERIAELVVHGLDAYDLVVFDTAPSGHTLRLLALPGQLAGWTDTLLANRASSERFSAAMRGLTGRRGEQPAAEVELRRALSRRRERFERMQQTITDPEATSFAVVFAAEAIPVAETLEVVAALERMQVPIAALIANRLSPADAGYVLRARHENEQRYVAKVRSQVSAPVLEVPHVVVEPTGLSALTELARRLTER